MSVINQDNYNTLRQFDVNAFVYELKGLLKVKRVNTSIITSVLKEVDDFNSGKLDIDHRKINGTLKILSLFGKFWLSQKKYFKPLIVSELRSPHSNTKDIRWIDTFLKSHVINLNDYNITKENNGEDTSTHTLESLNIHSLDELPEESVINNIGKVYNLIKRKIQHDKRTVCYGSFSAFVLNGLDESKTRYGDIDLYSSTAYKYLIVLMIITKMVYDIDLEIFTFPYMIGHMGLRLVNGKQQIKICDCVDLPSDVMNYIPKTSYNGYYLLDPHLQILRYIQAVMARGIDMKQYIKYKNNILMFNPYFQVSTTMSPLPDTIIQHSSVLVNVFSPVFLVMHIDNIIPVFILTSDAIRPLRVRAYELESVIDKIVYKLIEGKLTKGYRVCKSRQFGLYFPVAVYEIRLQDMLVGIIMAPYTYNIYISNKKLSHSSVILVLILLCIYANTRKHRIKIEVDLLNSVQLSEYKLIESNCLYAIKERIQQTRLETEITEVARYKPAGPHLNISLLNARFVSILTLDKKVREFVLFLDGPA